MEAVVIQLDTLCRRFNDALDLLDLDVAYQDDFLQELGEKEPGDDITSTDLEEARAEEDIPSPEYKPLWLVLEEMGIDYDSDQSRGC